MLIGRIGYGEAVDLTVVGNAVNVASRLEAVAKQKGFQIVMSSDVATYAGCLDDAGPVLIVNVRGVDAPMEVVGIMRGRDLPASILAAAPTEGPKTTAQRLRREPASRPVAGAGAVPLRLLPTDSASRPVSRVLSGVALRDGHSSGARIAPCLEQPTRAAARIALGARVAPRTRAAPIRSCSRWGLPCRLRCRTRGALLPHRFTLACCGLPRAGGLFSVALSLGSPPAAVSRHR